jgi:hypothetical protein
LTELKLKKRREDEACDLFGRLVIGEDFREGYPSKPLNTIHYLVTV